MSELSLTTGGGRGRKTGGGGVRVREIEVLIISAQDLKNVKHVTKMRPYAEVYVDKDLHVARTQEDDHGSTNPTWNEVVRVRFHDDIKTKGHVLAALNVDIYARGRARREKPVGSARVLLSGVLRGGDASEPADNPIQCITLQVWRPSGRPHGFLNLWVPPTGRFLIRRQSLSFSVKDEVDVDDDQQAAHNNVKLKTAVDAVGSS